MLVLSTGDFAQLNEFVMSTWTNDIAVQSINQDPLGVPARRIDNVSAIGPGTILPRGSPTTAVQLQQQQHHDTTTDQEGLGASSGSGKNVALMTVGECGGEPEDQHWTVNAKGFLANAATDTCINVIADAWGHCSILIYDSCQQSWQTAQDLTANASPTAVGGLTAQQLFRPAGKRWQ